MRPDRDHESAAGAGAIRSLARCPPRPGPRTRASGTRGPASTRRPRSTTSTASGPGRPRCGPLSWRSSDRPSARAPHLLPPAVPLRPRHPELGAARRARRGHRHLGRGGRAGAQAGRRDRPRRPRRVRVRRRVRGRSRPRRTRVRRGASSSWGAIEWLPDLERWADVVARHPQAGRHLLYGRDPPVRVRARRGAGRARPCTPSTEPLPVPADRPDVEPVEGSYADMGADTQGLVSYGWPHSFGRDHRRPHRRRPAPGAPARVPHVPVPVLGLDGPRRRPLVVAAGGGTAACDADLPFSYSLRATRPRA